MVHYEQAKILIFPDTSPTEEQEKLLQLVVSLTEEKLKGKLRREEVPEKLGYIVVEVSVKRYNRIGSEGMSKETVEGHSMEFQSNDFSEYQDAIDAFLEEQDEERQRRKKVYFL